MSTPFDVTRRTGTQLALGVALTLGAGSYACSASSPDEPSNCPSVATVPDGGSSVAVSFRSDVLPVFTFSCSFASCNGTTRADRVYLGKTAAPSTVRSALLERSNRSDMALVAPYRSEESFLMFKLDGNLCQVASRCPDGCGEPMPRSGGLLDEAKRETIRRWISEGALDN